MKIKSPYLLFFLQLFILFPVNGQKLPSASAEKLQINLAGNWHFQTDSADAGVAQHWFSRELQDQIVLPGSMTTNGKGDEITLKTPWTGSIFDSSWYKKPEYEKYRKPGNIKVPFWLQPVKYYKGAAWYQKTVEIPASWKQKHIELFIERSHWETTVWVDNISVGMQNSLATAHVFDLSKVLTAGKHRITIRVDNRIKDINVGQNSHSITDHTQTNWNGMIGKLLLEARPAVYIQQVQLYPDVKNKQVTAKITVNNTTGKPIDLNIGLAAAPENQNGNQLPAITKTQKAAGKNTLIEVVYPMGAEPLLWSEFHPEVYKMLVSVAAKGSAADQKAVLFGMRDFKTSGTQFTINGKLTFLRGTLECAAFPKTGYPPTDIKSWMEIMKICKSYGLNHLRFHSWCPPEAAFEAADRLGFYLQIECSSWANQGSAVGDGKPVDAYIYEESQKIVADYGNHPSFCMLTYGNEPGGKNQVKYLTDFVNYWKKRDARRLYTTGAGWPVVADNDYNSTADPRIQQWAAGLKSIINSEAPKNNYDWTNIIKKWNHPTVSHEIGQWCVYPDFKEMARYDGVLKAKNYEIFKDRLTENGLDNLAENFLSASGKLQALCYKADIEAALRTPGFGGFQLLGLYDFPGQGTALVGVLNAFWHDKGYISGPEYSRFCGPVIPLIRLPKMVYLNSETLSFSTEIAQFSDQVLAETTPAWNIKNEAGAILYQGNLAKRSIPIGNNIGLGKVEQSLSSISKPAKLTITVDVAGHQNSWEIFVYPAELPKTDEKILVTQSLDQKALSTLQNGGKVLLTLKKGSLEKEKGGDIAIGFSSIFWNTAWTNHQPPETLGILCDPKHPALKEFPTQSYSNWQWWDAMSHSSAIKLDAVAKGLQPIVRVIDDWVTARSLGLVFECKVGKGKLIVSGIDLLTSLESRPEAKQLLYSLESYMGKPAFAPSQQVEIQQITSLLK